MKKGMKYFGVAVLLACLLILCMAPAACKGIDEQLQVLSAAEEAVPVPAGDVERIESLTALIVMYSEQLEEYDRSNGSFVVACVGFAGVVLGLAINLSISKKEKGGRTRPDYGMAALFVLIPGTIALCLYVFSMQCRRVVFFRGYLTYLEGKLGELTGIPMVFNSKVVGKFFGEFKTMNTGFWVMGITVGAILAMSLVFCGYFALPVDGIQKIKQWNSWRKLSKGNISHKAIELCKVLVCFLPLVLFALIFAVFSWSSIVCVIDLCSNGDIPDRVCDFCMTFS